jgi:hypothetical protein
VTAREEILAAAQELTGRSPDGTFGIDEVMRAMAERGGQYAESTIRTHITSRMCADAPDHHAKVYDDFLRVGSGRYRLRGAPS